MATSAQLERKAERARERLSDRIADLRSQLSPMTVGEPSAGRCKCSRPGKMTSCLFW